MSKEKRRTSSKRRTALTKATLLPLSAAVVQRKSLEHHHAFTTLKSGHGNLDVISPLFLAIYLAYFVRDMTSRTGDLIDFRTEAGFESSGMSLYQQSIEFSSPNSGPYSCPQCTMLRLLKSCSYTWQHPTLGS
ncbi:hypothetical protein G3O06_23100 [Burkholderia sp. Ac-20345]|uniref:hypothetical protein n=1 Tax=Burkholderia sp. Ac-20345 TaxID=2703891 RepID=UPI00197B9758|nr:hypothetical protein [Burkholderia sp. Ac-20345]MBN3780413.1 hypothetical protein [Burkholderia sp. Ac-20345]